MNFKIADCNAKAFDHMLMRHFSPKGRAVIRRAFDAFEKPKPNAKGEILARDKYAAEAKNLRIAGARKNVREGMRSLVISTDVEIRHRGATRKKDDPKATMDQKVIRVIQAFKTGRLDTLIKQGRKHAGDYDEGREIKKIAKNFEFFIGTSKVDSDNSLDQVKSYG